MSPSKVSTLSFDTFSNIVDGQPRSAKSFHQGINPVTGEKLWDVPIATQQDVDDAVKSAEKAFKTWSREPVEKRKELLQKYCDLYMSHSDEMTTLLCKETGKPVCSTFGERCISSLQFPASIRSIRSQCCLCLVRSPHVA